MGVTSAKRSQIQRPPGIQDSWRTRKTARADGTPFFSGRLRTGLTHGDSELGVAGFRWVIEGIAAAVRVGGFEKESALEAVGQAGNARLAIDVGAHFEVKLVGAGESVRDADLDFRCIHRLAVGARDGEVGRTGSEFGIHHGNRVRISGGRLSQAGEWQGEEEGENQRDSH